jgi:predicted alpha/beta-hydrolase family hydrolase
VDRGAVSALLEAPHDARFCYVLAHGAGAGMRHPFLETMARELARRGGASLRYNFPYMEARKKRPDPPDVATATVRAAVLAASSELPGVPLLAGGKSFGGRMTSQAQAAEPLSGVIGLVFLGFPLHPPGRPGTERAEHLERVKLPMLFLQGTRDEFATMDLLRPLVERLGPRATLHLVEGGDHSFRVPKTGAASQGEITAALAQAIAEWAARWGS